jgi:hypothetical protein
VKYLSENVLLRDSSDSIWSFRDIALIFGIHCSCRHLRERQSRTKSVCWFRRSQIYYSEMNTTPWSSLDASVKTRFLAPEGARPAQPCDAPKNVDRKRDHFHDSIQHSVPARQQPANLSTYLLACLPRRHQLVPER